MRFSELENLELVELIPFGILSDKYSRKLFSFYFPSQWRPLRDGLWQPARFATARSWLVADNPAGYFYTVFPPQSIFGQSLFYLLCGGDGVAFANMLAIIADCVHDEVERC